MLKLILAVLPSAIKIKIYRALGYKIGKNCYIGLAIIDAKDVNIGDCVYIGHLNLIWRLKRLDLESGSRLEFCNWITGAREGSFKLGRNSAIQRFHFFEASSNISLGDNCIIAGRNSHFFSHGISSTDLDVRRDIIIGNWSYVGSGVRFVPGAGVAECTFVGMGAVVTKRHGQGHVLIAGNPAAVKKNLSPEDLYFKRAYLPHCHHPKDYRG
jgi:acetyltransferase-like isoleucine patch superfamily enzyme